ncbi:phosphoribosylamine--glycine ligase [Inconstantimicrobium porci]|uniref:Phosphoribosylamine--glycine ligase n=1 Tax=Inconstantimicrobium porci TaxID=2652291 RepID=A0A7X2T067_9CLOT|nr:phosphoribosylamine--glycine ligase [Inconstantimicrobium porci]MSR90242.1 phosphoribosylamine--glycine ligase [Inconstantimicrobium porci]
MDILLIGSGGREHAIARKLSRSEKVDKIYVAPGNGGTEKENKCENIAYTDNNKLLEFAKENNIDLTIVGPEVPLIEGIVDLFKENNLKIFGPSQKAAMLEGSKVYSKEFMKKYGVKTAQYESFDNVDDALNYVKNANYPLVVKADGLAAGKGVIICNELSEAIDAVNSCMTEDIFNGAGKKIVVEEFLEGVEASILSITDGKTIVPFISAKDHKQIYDGGKGPNTGGMGAIAPNPYVTDGVMEDFKINIMDKTLEGIKQEKLDYKGIIFFGLMITDHGTYLLEYNVRMGDPETQSVLELMNSDFVDVINACLEEKLADEKIKWKDGACVNVVAASSGYPYSYEKGFTITIDDSVKNDVIIAGAARKNDELVTTGGRVLSVVALGKNYEEAQKNAYNKLKGIKFESMVYRHDIGKIK